MCRRARAAGLEIMFRRFVSAPFGAVALAAMAVAGFAFALVVVVAMFMLGLIPIYPASVRFARRIAGTGRRASNRFGGVPVDSPYQPPPPRRRPDGWLQHDRQLYRSPRIHRSAAASQ